MRQRRQEVRPKGECGRDCGRSERTASAKGNRRRRPSHLMPLVSAAPSPSPLCRHRRCPHGESTGLRRCAERSSSTHAAYTSTLFARKSGRTRASTHKQTHARMHAHTNTRTHACTHTHTQTHARRILVSTQRRSSLCCWFQALRIESLLCCKARSVWPTSSSSSASSESCMVWPCSVSATGGRGRSFAETRRAAPACRR